MQYPGCSTARGRLHAGQATAQDLARAVGSKASTCMATAVDDSARPPPRMIAPGPCTAASADTVAAMTAVLTSTCK
jgi:hypothetical protein